MPIQTFFNQISIFMNLHETNLCKESDYSFNLFWIKILLFDQPRAFCLYLRNQIFPTHGICVWEHQIIYTFIKKKKFEKINHKSFQKFQKTIFLAYFWLIFSNFTPAKKESFSKNSALSSKTSNEFLMPCQNYKKLMILL